MACTNIRQGWQRNGYHDQEPKKMIGSPSLIRLRKQSLSEIDLRLLSDSESPEGGYYSEQLVQDDGPDCGRERLEHSQYAMVHPESRVEKERLLETRIHDLEARVSVNPSQRWREHGSEQTDWWAESGTTS
jgi:hypothetical protein